MYYRTDLKIKHLLTFRCKNILRILERKPSTLDEIATELEKYGVRKKTIKKELDYLIKLGYVEER